MNKKILGSLGDATLLLAVITGFLYITGESYHSGLINKLELNNNLFSAPFEQSVSTGSYSLFIGGIYIVIPLLMISIVLSAHAYMIGELSTIPFVRKMWNFLFDFLSTVKSDKSEMPETVVKLSKVTSNLLVFALFIGLLLVLTYQTIDFSRTLGEDAAIEKQKKHHRILIILRSPSTRLTWPVKYYYVLRLIALSGCGTRTLFLPYL